MAEEAPKEIVPQEPQEVKEPTEQKGDGRKKKEKKQKQPKPQPVDIFAGKETIMYVYHPAELALKGKDGGVYCLGSGEPRKLAEYIEKIRDKIAPDATLGLGDIPYAEGQVMYLCADISELQEDTGYTPSTSFEDGIAKTIAWYKERNGK